MQSVAAVQPLARRGSLVASPLGEANGLGWAVCSTSVPIAAELRSSTVNGSWLQLTASEGNVPLTHDSTFRLSYSKRADWTFLFQRSESHRLDGESRLRHLVWSWRASDSSATDHPPSRFQQHQHGLRRGPGGDLHPGSSVLHHPERVLAVTRAQLHGNDGMLHRGMGSGQGGRWVRSF